VTLREMGRILEADVMAGEDQLDVEVSEGGCSDLVTEIPIYGKAGIVLLRGLTDAGVIRACHDLGIAALVMVRGKNPTPEAARLAKELKLPLFTTEFILYEAVGRLYRNGLRGCMEKVE
jgi:hypothetical protein